MSKKEQQKVLAEITAIKAYNQRIDINMGKYVEELQKINAKFDRIEEKFDLIIKWSKFNGQVWDKN